MRAASSLFLLAAVAVAQPLSGTKPLTSQTDFADEMLSGMDRWLLRELAASPGRRAGRGASSEEKRERFRKMIGVVDQRVAFDSLTLVATLSQPALVAETTGYLVHAVRWPVLEGVDAEGLLLQPRRPPAARIVVLPDADSTPEMVAGLAAGVPAPAHMARRLADAGCEVLVPVLIDRRPVGRLDPWSPRPTNQSRREFVYRMAFEMGRHIAGYEVQKVLAAVDWFARQPSRRPIGVAGYGEGGLVALYSAVVDTRIDAAVVSGYFGPREKIWTEPVYRNVWGLLTEFGDAELAVLVGPRALIVEASRGPEVPEPAPGTRDTGVGAAPGVLTSPELEAVRAEVRRSGSACTLIEGQDLPGSDAALTAFLEALGQPKPFRPAAAAPPEVRVVADAAGRQQRQFRQLVDYSQKLVYAAPRARAQFWSKADASSVEKWNQTKEPYRRHLWEEILGKLPPPSEPLAAFTRLIYDKPGFRGYEVQLPIWPDVFAYGILLVPKNLRPGERRPVVVTQHGRGGRPQEMVAPQIPRDEQVYKHFAAQLAERGFITYSPQNPYIFEERYRYIQRKANPLKLSLFSFIAAQHDRLLDWLVTLPFVDPARIAFYGLSYGGKTAVRVPPLLDRYAVCIASGDFNEYTGKMAATDRPDSFMFTIEHEMYEFDLGNTFNYAEMANLMAPRPFMVERGHNDGVGLDEWVAHEYAKVRRFYAALGLADRTEIEFRSGGHEIYGVGTFRFLHKHLNWPEP